MPNGKKIGCVAALVLTIVSTGAAAAPSAFASGRSATKYGCYSTWGSTGSSTHCYNVPKTITVRTHADCPVLTDELSPWKTIKKGQTVKDFGQADCFTPMRRAYPEFK